jgi:hypothetical protein
MQSGEQLIIPIAVAAVAEEQIAPQEQQHGQSTRSSFSRFGLRSRHRHEPSTVLPLS